MTGSTTILQDARKFYRKNRRAFGRVKFTLEVLIFFVSLLSLIVGDRFVMIERIHVTVHDVDLDLKNASTHLSDTLKCSDSLTVTVGRVNSTTEMLSGG